MRIRFCACDTMWELFVAFFKIGLFTFGGGYAMLPIIQRELVEDKKWCTEEEILDYYAMSQCTPGVIAVNVATFVGYRVRGVLGGIAATGAVVLPSLIIITVIAAFLSAFSDIPAVQHALAGIRVAVAVLVFRTVLTLIKKNIRSAFSAIICLTALSLTVVFDVSSMYIVIAAILFGLLFGRLGGKRA